MKKEQSSKHRSNACILIALQPHVCLHNGLELGSANQTWIPELQVGIEGFLACLLALLTSRRGGPETTWGSSISMSSGLCVTLPGSSAGRPSSRQKPKTFSRFHFESNNSNTFAGSAARPTDGAFRSTSHCLFPNTWLYLALENGNAVKRRYL